MSAPRLRLLLITAHASRAGGGVSVATRDLARLMMQDADVRVLALADGPTRAEDEPEWQGIAVTTFGTLGPRRYGFSAGLLLAMLRAPADAVHVHGLWKFHCLAMLVLHLVRRIPYVVSPHGMLEPWILARSPKTKRLISRAYQHRFLRAAAAVHVLTDQERRDVSAVVEGVPCVTIPNFVQPVTANQPRPAWWTQDMETRVIFLFLGRIHSKKGCLELCEAWERLNTRHVGFKAGAALVFCGAVDDLSDFPNRIGALAARFGNIWYAGPQYGREKHSSLGAATFFCLPSKSEGLPMAVIEAWAAGVPAIMTPQCNLPVGFTKGAAIATGTEATAIEASLAAAVALPPERLSAMASAARLLAETEFSVRYAERSYRELYNSATIGRRHTR